MGNAEQLRPPLTSERQLLRFIGQNDTYGTDVADQARTCALV